MEDELSVIHKQAAAEKTLNESNRSETWSWSETRRRAELTPHEPKRLWTLMLTDFHRPGLKQKRVAVGDSGARESPGNTHLLCRSWKSWIWVQTQGFLVVVSCEVERGFGNNQFDNQRLIFCRTRTWVSSCVFKSVMWWHKYWCTGIFQNPSVWKSRIETKSFSLVNIKLTVELYNTAKQMTSSKESSWPWKPAAFVHIV